MSFSTEIKKSICKTEYMCPVCRLAELAGFFGFTGKTGGKEIKTGAALEDTAKRIRTALSDEFNISAEDGSVIRGADADKLNSALDGYVPSDECCAISYIRGAFLGGGSVSDPKKEYHLEFDTKSEVKAEQLINILAKLGFRAKRTVRKGKSVVYLKESGQIADLIGYMSGGRAGLEIMSIQVEKELKSATQRRVNCDSANLNKQVIASSRQIAAIRKIKAARKWSALPDVLREIGDLRVKNPYVSIEELGSMTKQKIGKSGVNHRLKRIIEYSETLPEK